MQDGSLFSIQVINSAGSTVTFSQDYWGQSWYCIQQQVLKYTDCPGTWTVQIFCDNPSNACKLPSISVILTLHVAGSCSPCKHCLIMMLQHAIGTTVDCPSGHMGFRAFVAECPRIMLTTCFQAV